MNNKTVFYIMGVSGSGKSTIGKLLAKELELPFFDGDDFHPEENIKKMAAGNALNDSDRKGWLTKLNSLSAANKNTGAVIACSALKQSYRNILSENIALKIEFVYLNGTFAEISERLKQRSNHFMPLDLLQSQFDTLEIPSEAITVSIQKSPEEIIDHILNAIKSKKP